MPDKINENTTAGEYVTEVHQYDVLFGRGSGPNDHEGNIRFRELVSQRKTEYMATNHRQTKAKIAKDIVDQVFNVGGRFLKKLEPAEANKIPGYENVQHDIYEVVGDDTIMEKAKQALRQNRNRDDQNVSPKPSPGGVQSHPTAVMSSSMNSANHPAAVAAAMMNAAGMNMGGGGGSGSGSMFHPPLTQTPSQELLQQQQQFAYAQAAQAQQQQHHHQLQQRIIPQAASNQPITYGTNALVPPQQAQRANSNSSMGGLARNDAMYSLDNEGYATYTTTLDDPDDERYFSPSRNNQPQNFDRRQFMEMAGSTGNSSTRRSSLLGGRKPDPLTSGIGGGSAAAAAMAAASMQQQQQQQLQQPPPFPQQMGLNHMNVGKRESLQFDDIWRRTSVGSSSGTHPGLTKDAVQSMQMSDLMESFKGMSTTGDMNASDDTIGTIDGLPVGMSLAHMSGISQMSMNMSTDSIFKNPLGTSGPGSTNGSKHSSMSSGGSGGSHHRRRRKGSTDSADNVNTINEETAVNDVTNDTPAPNAASAALNKPNDSIATTELWNSRQLQGLMQGPMESSSINFDISHNQLSTDTFLRGNNSKDTTPLSVTNETTTNLDVTITAKPSPSNQQG